MEYSIWCFGIARDIVGAPRLLIQLDTSSSVADLKEKINRMYEGFGQLKTYRIAVNQNIADDQTILSAGDEIAIIPPVSGG